MWFKALFLLELLLSLLFTLRLRVVLAIFVRSLGIYAINKLIGVCLCTFKGEYLTNDHLYDSYFKSVDNLKQ